MGVRARLLSSEQKARYKLVTLYVPRCMHALPNPDCLDFTQREEEMMGVTQSGAQDSRQCMQHNNNNDHTEWGSGLQAAQNARVQMLLWPPQRCPWQGNVPSLSDEG